LKQEKKQERKHKERKKEKEEMKSRKLYNMQESSMVHKIGFITCEKVSGKDQKRRNHPKLSRN
jgi:hypothetical protein